MNQPSEKREPAHWEITAGAFLCDYIGEFVTIRVSQDWAAGCAWYLKYKSNRSKEKLEGTIRGRIDKCVGPECPIIIGYRDKLIEEEFGKEEQNISA